ncbi:MAG TPA: sensor histidine kinase [Solirubrobacteraceae bacterium]|nr:sensor histidine kinase [Solirubrobacteraceae bacterium]
MTDRLENHGLFVYDDDDDFVDRIASFLGPGTADGEAGMAVLSQAKWAMLREALGDAAKRIRYLDRDSLYTRPLAALADYDAVLRRAIDEGVPAVRLFGELPVSTSQEQCDGWTLYEAVVTRAFAGRGMSLLCGYDVREQPAAAVEGAWLTHPRVLADGWEDNPRYRDAAHVVVALTRRPEVLTDLRELPVETDMETFRSRLRQEVASLQVPNTQAEDLLLAAGEVFDNARTHGHGARSQRLGRVAGLIVWELSDNGPGFDDPLAGYLPPQDEDGNGTGLWIVRQLVHDMQFLASPRGFTTRLWI